MDENTHSPFRSIRDPFVQQTLSASPSDKRFHKSPEAWEDQILYFLLPDRFSDGQEQGYKDRGNNIVTTGTTPLFRPGDGGNATKDATSKARWLEAGTKFVGGTIQGAKSKLGYLKRMGVTAIWIGPVFKQVAGLETYHGYGVQDFLEVDRRFGTRDDLKELVQAAHAEGIYVLLDVILNHSGDVFAYQDAHTPYKKGQQYEVKGFWGAERNPAALLPFGPVEEAHTPHGYPDGAIWPAELQGEEIFARKGHICDWETAPEYVEGDFVDFKSFNLGPFDVDGFTPTPALTVLCDIFKFWIAFADVDGFRIDTVKHMGDGPTKYFVMAIHEFTRGLGKANFLLVGEIPGPRAFDTVRATGLDAALAIDGLQRTLWRIARGLSSPVDYFSAFHTTRPTAAPHRLRRCAGGGWAGHQLVTMLDDHDQVWRPATKARFCSTADGPSRLDAALGLNLCALGIPCLYYGTEQRFDGDSAHFLSPGSHCADRFLREAMFGGEFGAFQSRHRHFFDESSPTYRTLQQLTDLRAREIALRRGSQHLREVSLDGVRFRLPAAAATGESSRALVAWSRIYAGVELLCLLNPDAGQPVKAWVALDTRPHRQKAGTTGEKAVMRCLYPPGESHVVQRERMRSGRVAVLVNLPPAGFMVYK